MIRAAGILFIAPDNQALFLKRGPGGDHPGEWCFPGGQVEADETLEACASREAIEEIGFIPDGKRVLLTRSVSLATSPNPTGPLPLNAAPPIQPPLPPEQVDYTTFLQRLPYAFLPQLNGEHTAYAWAKPSEPPEPLHPGCRIALARLSMDELGISRAMAAGELTSPQKYQNVWLFAMRITGTGLAYRTSWDEYVWRDPSIYLNEEFLARCNGLPVIWEHPPTDVLNSKEFAKRIIGAIMLPYLKGEEVWGIAKIHDDEAAGLMEKDQLSTSPSVVLRDADSTNLKLEDGSALLIEGKPSLLDHLAVCELGVWDKQGPPVGIQSDNAGDTSMADETEAEKKAREETEAADAKKRKDDDDARARKDAAAGEKLDQVLEHLKLGNARMDAMEKRMDDDAKKRKDDDDAKHRADDDDARHKRADDAAETACDDDDDAKFKKRMDAEEAEETAELVGKGEAKEVAADKAHKHRDDKEKWRMDRRQKKADDDKRRKDDDDAKRKADDARKDDDDAKKRADAINRAVDAALAAKMPKAESDEERTAKADAQALLDPVYQGFGLRAPPPMLGEINHDYKVRMYRELQKHSPTWKDVELHTLTGKVLEVAGQTIRTDAATAARNPVDIPAGQLREVQKVDPVTGIRTTEFFGQGTFIRGLARPSRRVVGSFNTKGN